MIARDEVRDMMKLGRGRDEVMNDQRDMREMLSQSGFFRKDEQENVYSYVMLKDIQHKLFGKLLKIL